MPRPISPELRDCLERANPYTEYRIEITEPDAVRIIRRADEYLATPPLVGAMVPANSLSADARGSLILTPGTAALASFAGEQSSYDLNGEDPTRRIKGAVWIMDPAFTAAKLRNVTARVQRVALAGLFYQLDFELQVFRVTKTPGNKELFNPATSQVQVTAFTDYSFTPLLNPAPVIKSASIVWDGTQKSTLNFDLTNYGLVLENTPSRAAAPDQAGELPRYYFVVRVLNNPRGTGFFKWLVDTASARTLANIGTFQRSFWARNNDQEQWAETLFADVPNFAVNVETYPASGQAVYAVDLPKVPDTARGSIGRIKFERSLPPGTAATLELSSDAGANYIPVSEGDALTPATRNEWSFSEQLEQAAWLKVSGLVITQNAAIAPDGTLTADKIARTAVSAAHRLERDPTPATDNTVQYDSVHVKAAEYPFFMFQTLSRAGTTLTSALNTATGLFTTKQHTPAATGANGITAEPVPNYPGWYRVTVSWNIGTGATLPRFRVYSNATSSTATSQIGDGVSGGYVWGLMHQADSTTLGRYVRTGSTGLTLAPAQLNYRMRLTLATTVNTLSPTVVAFGVEYRIPLDVSVEGIPTLPTREVALPWPKASIPEGKVDVVRTGVRDYLDTGSILGSTQATTKLECDIYLASRHPLVTRDKWLQLERLAVSNRVPGATSEAFTLLSYASKLKKKIPQKVESLNSVHTVTGGSTTAVNVTPVLPGTSAGGNEYDAKGYYMRVRSTSNVNVAVGFVQTIQGNTGTGQLDFTPAMPSALSIGDVVEVHSGIFATQAISWTDADPADVWDALLSYAGIPPERIGAGYLARGGKPPRVTDIAPGDATTQAKRKITNKIGEIESADELLAQVSAILGGVTMEMPGGQICFVQVFPLRDATGKVTVPLSPVVKIFDKRDYGRSLQTPPGLEKRATVMSATYGVPLTAAAPETYPKQTTVTVDNDALLWLTQQDLEDFGSASVPDKIARWLYNTADAGLYLAASVTATYVRALSTGLRVFPFNAVEKNPELVPGDSVVILTDQYTDYEPSSATPLRGMLAVRGVLVQVGAEGRQLALFVPGLQDNVTQAQGGFGGTLTGLGDPVDAPILSGAFTPAGELIITSFGSYNTASQKIAVGTVEPTDAFTRAGTPILFQNLTNIATGLIVPAGGSAWIKAFGYDNYGTESPVARMKVTREGSGTADPPVVLMYPLNGDSSDLNWNIRFDAVPGSGGGGTNLTYDIRKKIGFAAETSIASGNGTTLPRDLNLARHPRSDAVIRFIVTDVATGLTAQDSFLLPSARPELADTGDQFTSGVKEPGGKLVSRLYAKALPADPDTADAIGTGIVKRTIPFSVLRSTDDALVTRVDESATIGSRPASDVERGTGTTVWTEVFDSIAGWSVNTGTPATSTSSDSTRGTKVLTSVGYTAMTWGGKIPFDSQKLYRFRARFQKLIGESGGNQAALYLGVRGYLYDGSFANTNGGASYILLSNFTFNSAIGSFTVTGWVKGASVAAGSASSPSTDPTAPSPLNIGTVFIQPYILLNFPLVGTPVGVGMIDFFEITEYDEDAGDRTYTILDLGQKLKTAAKESGGAAVNRLLAKTLAGDPNVFDSVPDGTSFKKVGGVNGSNQITPTSTVGRMRCALKQSATQSVGAGAALVAGWDLEDYDVGGMHDNVTNNNRITIPTGGDTGVWLLRAHQDFQGNNSAGNRGLHIRNSAGTRIAGQEVYLPAGANPLSSGELEVTRIINTPVVGDWFEVLTVNQSGVAQTVGGNNGTTMFEAVHLW